MERNNERFKKRKKFGKRECTEYKERKIIIDKKERMKERKKERKIQENKEENRAQNKKKREW